MKGRILNIVLVLVLATLPMAANAGWSEAQQVTDQTLPAPAQVEETPAPDVDFKSSPVMFIENVGQWDDGARFQAWGGPAGTMWLAEDAIWITVMEAGGDGETSRQGNRGEALGGRWLAEAPGESLLRRAVAVKLSFVGANPQPEIETFDRLDTKVSYFIGHDPEQWRPEVPVWGGVRYAELYPGVDLELASAEGQIALGLAARPDADLGTVVLRVEGVEAVTLDAGLLRLSTAVGVVALPLLQAEGAVGTVQGQPIGGGAFEVVAPFAPLSASSPPAPQHGPDTPTDNPADLLYSTFLGGSSWDDGSTIAVDGAGNAYATGQTMSIDFPTTPGAFDTSYNGLSDAFVAKLNPAGSGLAYATFLGGSDLDQGGAVAVDGAGNAYVTGRTASTDFPTTPGAFDTSINGIYDAFVAKLNPAGSGLAYATFLGGSDFDLGGSDFDVGSAIAVDGAGNAYVTGRTASTDFPTTPGAFDTSYNGGEYGDAFVAKLNPNSSALAYATFLGGSDFDLGGAIAVDGAGSAYVTGSTASSNFPTTPGAFDMSFNGGEDAFVVKLNPAGSGLAYATFLGGSDGDRGYAIAVDGAGSAYVAGGTLSSNFPTTPGAFDTSINGSWDAFVAKLNPAGSGLAYATFLGAYSHDEGFAIAVDVAGSSYVAGYTYPGFFPTTPGAFDTSHNGSGDAFVAELNPAGSGLAYATFLGGSDFDLGGAIAVDGAGRAYVTGYTKSSNFPTTPGAFDTSYNGSREAFVAKLAMGGGGTPGTHTISGRVTTSNGTGIQGVTISDNAGHTAVTNANGNYTLSGLSQGTYTITPSRSGYTFSPASRTVSVPPSASNIDFQGSTSISTYSISGRVTTVFGVGISGVTIRDNAGHTAVTNASGYYTLSSLSARTYTITPSKGGYTFGPASQTVSVPPSASNINFTGHDQLPMVLVHGFQGINFGLLELPGMTCVSYNPDDTFGVIKDLLRQANRYTTYAYLETNPCATPSLAQNVDNLIAAIDRAKRETGQSRVILIAHSMGGLVSRAYLESGRYRNRQDVESLFTFGSPHLGIPSDVLVFPANGVSLGEFCDSQKAACEFSTLGMLQFNLDHPYRASGVNYHFVSGDAPFTPRTVPGMLFDRLLVGPDDGAVQTWSGKGIGLRGPLYRFETNETHGTGSGPRSYFESYGGASTSYYECLRRVLIHDPPTGTCGSFSPTEQAATVSTSSAERTPFLHGALTPGQTSTQLITIEGGATSFAAQWQPGTVAMTLVSPTGQTIDPEYAVAHPDIVTYEESPGYALYSFTNAAPGEWQVLLGALDVPTTGAAYTAFAFVDSALTLQANTDRPWYTPGSTVAISATLSPAPQSATVVATVIPATGASTSVTLTSLGGGRYSANYTVPPAPGYAEVRLTATGVNSDGAAFERGTSLAFQISPNTVALNGSYSDTPEPRWPGASIYQALNVSVGVNVNATGSYGLSAELVDAAGNTVAHTNVISDLTSGARTLTLRFDGADIYESQRDGPYRLTNLLLTDHNGAALVVQEAQDVYTTAAYSYRDFRVGDLFLPLILR